MAKSCPRVKPGDRVSLRLMRLPVYADAKHVPAYKETTQTFEVIKASGGEWFLKPTRKLTGNARFRRFRMSCKGMTMFSASPSPLRYEVHGIKKTR